MDRIVKTTPSDSIGTEIDSQRSKLIKALRGASNTSVKVEDILPLIIKREQCFDGGEDSCSDIKFSVELPSKEEIDELGILIEELIREKKCKVNGVCDLSDKIFLRLFNEMIRQVAIDCPERGILLSLIRDQIVDTVGNYKRLLHQSGDFCMRREIEHNSQIDQLTQDNKDLRNKLLELKTQKNLLKSSLINLESLHKDLEIKKENKRKEEIEYNKMQNSNMEDFLRNVKAINDPLELKNTYQKQKI